MERSVFLKLLHYDSIGLGDWKQKWERRLKREYIPTLRDNRRLQFDAFKESYSKGDDALYETYQKIYFIPSYERWVLRKLGMLVTIDIERDKFHLLGVTGVPL